jgi:hypothetical protein
MEGVNTRGGTNKKKTQTQKQQARPEFGTPYLASNRQQKPMREKRLPYQESVAESGDGDDDFRDFSHFGTRGLLFFPLFASPILLERFLPLPAERG